MPQYTLHEERHFLNVLAIMDALVPDYSLNHFGPLDCVLPILAAFTHDLGMAISRADYDKIHDESTIQGRRFSEYRARYDAEQASIIYLKDQIYRLDKKSDKESAKTRSALARRVESIEGFILSSYLRDTHTDSEQLNRLNGWFDAIKNTIGDENLFRYGVGGKDFQRELVLIGLSHSREASWLRKQLVHERQEDSFCSSIGTGEFTNIAFPGLLLRLADIMDFDASRTPRILFTHFGIDSDKSILEWSKHLSVVGWRFDVDEIDKSNCTLQYSAESSHPVHEKLIREFMGCINNELLAVRNEFGIQQRLSPGIARLRYDLILPTHSRLEIQPVRVASDQRKKYIYRDIQFKLSQDEIQNLLMGESLYGDPALCIRELLQNSLDAVDLRSLRLKMKKNGDGYTSAVGSFVHPGVVREADGVENDLRVSVDWGVDEYSGQKWLRVTDNGVGMTDDVIEKYFTQVGRSYYRSPEFRQERSIFREGGELSSPISIFGIGILSCFMIADRIEVCTCSDGANGGQCESRDVSISGPGSLFWLKDGTRKNPGTEIRLFLKSRFNIKIQPKNSGSSNSAAQSNENSRDPNIIDPVQLIAKYVSWPPYPVCVMSKNKKLYEVNQNAPADALEAEVEKYDSSLEFSLSVMRRVARQLKMWDIDTNTVCRPSWWDLKWKDDKHPDGTGSQIRFFYPLSTLEKSGEVFSVKDVQGKIRAIPWSSIIHEEFDSQTRVSVNGMHIDDISDIEKFIVLRAGPGARIWIDLRGDACPALTVDRRRAYRPKDVNEWAKIIMGVFKRFVGALVSGIDGSSPEVYSNLRNGLIGLTPFKQSPIFKCSLPRIFDFTLSCGVVMGSTVREIDLEFEYRRFLQKNELLKRKGIYNDESIRVGVGKSLRRVFDEESYHFDYDRKVLREMVLELAARAELPFSLSGELEEEIDFDSDFYEALEIRERRELDDECMLNSQTLRSALFSSVLQEDFWPSLKESSPRFGLSAIDGNVGDSLLIGPGIVEFEGDMGKVKLSDPAGKLPSGLTGWGYDLVFPMTAIPIGELRRNCPKWRSDRTFRSLGVAPFLLPSLANVWVRYVEFFRDMFGVSKIFCFLPKFDLWRKPFAEWTDLEWNDECNLSGLLDLSGEILGMGGQLFWAKGRQRLHDMRVEGVSARKMFL